MIQRLLSPAETVARHETLSRDLAETTRLLAEAQAENADLKLALSKSESDHCETDWQLRQRIGKPTADVMPRDPLYAGLPIDEPRCCVEFDLFREAVEKAARDNLHRARFTLRLNFLAYEAIPRVGRGSASVDRNWTARLDVDSIRELKHVAGTVAATYEVEIN